MARILVADDETDILELIGFTLEYAGHQVLRAPDGATALEQARQLPPDLIVLDVRMPGLNGYEVCQQLKQDETTRSIPVVFLSAKGQGAEVDHGLGLGAVDYLVKPFAPDQLVRRLEEILSQKEASKLDELARQWMVEET
jgi:DNA-binding response OmpR family regulator